MKEHIKLPSINKDSANIKMDIDTTPLSTNEIKIDKRVKLKHKKKYPGSQITPAQKTKQLKLKQQVDELMKTGKYKSKAKAIRALVPLTGLSEGAIKSYIWVEEQRERNNGR